MGRRVLASLIIGIILLVPTGLGSNQAFGHGSVGTPITGVLFFTTFNNISLANCGPGGAAAVPADPCFGIGPGSFTVWKVSFSWDGSTLTFPGGVTPVALTNGADGIVGLPNTNFAIGGQNTGLIHEITQAGVQVNPGGTASGAAQAYHLGLNPPGTLLYSAGIPGGVGVMPFPLAPGAPNPVVDSIIGAPFLLTQIAWDGVSGLPFFTSSSAAGTGGSYGSLDPAISVATVVFSPVSYSHGMDYDTFCSKMTLFGDDFIAQIVTAAPTDPGIGPNANSMLFTGPGGIGLQYDQGVASGGGLVFAASNSGHMSAVDLDPVHTPGNVPGCNIGEGLPGDPLAIPNTPHPTDTIFLINNLDDLADVVLPPDEVGGNMIPIETTSLFAAGSQTSLAWLMPIIISTIGIGVFITQSNRFTFFRKF